MYILSVSAVGCQSMLNKSVHIDRIRTRKVIFYRNLVSQTNIACALYFVFAGNDSMQGVRVNC